MVEAARVVTRILKRIFGPLMNADKRRSAFIRVHQLPTLFLVFQVGQQQ